MRWESINEREDRSDKLTVVGGRFRASHAYWFVTLEDDEGKRLELQVNNFTQFVDSTGGSVSSLNDNDVVRVISDKKHTYMRSAMIVGTVKPVEIVDAPAAAIPHSREAILGEAVALLEAKAQAANARAVMFTEKLSGPLKGRKKSENWRIEKKRNEKMKYYYLKAADDIRSLINSRGA